MKKTVILLISLLSAGAVCLAGCQTQRAKNRAARQNTDTPIIEELPPEDNDAQTPDDGECPKDGCPRVIFKRRNGFAVGYYGQFGEGEFFVIQFGCGDYPDCENGESPEKLAKRPPRIDPRLPAEPNN